METSAFTAGDSPRVRKPQGKYVETLPPLDILKMFKPPMAKPADDIYVEPAKTSNKVETPDSDPISAFYRPPESDPIAAFYKPAVSSFVYTNDPVAPAVVATPMIKPSIGVTPVVEQVSKPSVLLPELPQSAFGRKPTLTPKGPTGLSNKDLAKLASFESGNTGYTAFNKGSGAYGKYQFIPSTASEYSAKLGFKGDEWKKPENQEKMFSAFVADNVRGLKQKGLPINLFNVYGAHQQGLTGLSDILAGNMSPSLEKNMRSNLPSEYRNLSGDKLRNTWIKYWKTKTEN